MMLYTLVHTHTVHARTRTSVSVTVCTHIRHPSSHDLLCTLQDIPVLSIRYRCYRSYSIAITDFCCVLASVVHHFIAMIRCGKTVHFSPVVSTQDAIRGFLDISGPFHFDDIDQNFELEIEIYGMVGTSFLFIFICLCLLHSLRLFSH